jgi:hypothetical protein
MDLQNVTRAELGQSSQYTIWYHVEPPVVRLSKAERLSGLFVKNEVMRLMTSIKKYTSSL